MTCHRGAASPDAATQKKLFADSAGYCQNPKCVRELFVDGTDRPVHIAEMAHIFAASDNGPRSNPWMSTAERGAYENLILLCANCHTMVDKAPDAFPDTLMHCWKRDHADRLRTVFGITYFESRTEARAFIEPILDENHTIFERYGPHIAAAGNPESGASETWRRKVVTRIIPNSKRLLAHIDANRTLLTMDERKTVEAFRQHIDDLTAVHVAGANEDVAQFPFEMGTLMEDC